MLIDDGIDPDVAGFVWDEVQYFYFDPLTPYPSDKPLSELKVDGDDLSDLAMKFEKKFNRKWKGHWIGPDDPRLSELALGLIASTDNNEDSR